MTKKNEKRLSQLETLIMDSVWTMADDSGAATTVRRVRDRLQAAKPMAYNTVLTVMRILRDKGFLSSRREGRMDVYWPRVSREQVGRRSLSEVMNRFFHGSATTLVSQLLDSGKLSDEEIVAIRAEVNRKLAGTAGTGGESNE